MHIGLKSSRHHLLRMWFGISFIVIMGVTQNRYFLFTKNVMELLQKPLTLNRTDYRKEKIKCWKLRSFAVGYAKPSKCIIDNTIHTKPVELISHHTGQHGWNLPYQYSIRYWNIPVSLQILDSSRVYRPFREKTR